MQLLRLKIKTQEQQVPVAQSLSQARTFWHGVQVFALMLFALAALAATQSPGTADTQTLPNRVEVCQNLTLEHCTHLAHQGDMDAQYFLAQHYVSLSYMRGRGHPAPEDDHLALEWMARAANQGHIRAQLQLGSFYQQGQFISADREQALAWYQRAAEGGDMDAKNALGKLRGAVAQGRFENMIFIICLLALVIFPSLSRKDQSLSGYARRFWFWAPHFTSLFVVAWWVSAGEWGRIKHPFVGSFMAGITPGMEVYIWICMPVLSGLIYLLTYFRYPQDRGHFWVSLALYVPMLLAASIFMYFMVQLAKLA